ncbi:MAG TPA: hypothetical protein VJB35_06445 [Candidatus Nanoarchaeia archaeon]|nr:hypothetical protein [Candidatus Nanoarchaeia archaeon]
MVKYEHKTYVITAAQGIQSPYSAKMYGRDETKGSPNIPLIKNIERYVEFNKGEIQIHSVVGASVNEIELDSFFHSRNDVYIEKDSKSRNEQNRKKEEAKRKSYYDKVEKRKAKEDEYDTKKQDECKTFPVDGSDCPFNAPMHYFWEKIPKTDWPLIGERLNTNVKTLGIPVRPQNKNPLSSKDTFTKDNGGNSVIIASPKKMMRPVAQGQSGEYPHLLLTTGACTHPNYNFGDLGFMAKRDHTYGFAVVDVLDDKIHLTRIVSAQKNGTFVDLGIKYQEGKEPEKVKTVALVVGDSHFAEINPKVDKANVQMMQALEPKHTHLNDIFAALSINIHEVDDPIRRNRMKKAHTNSLEEELYFAGKYLTRNAKIAGEWGGEIVVNFSNHDDMIYRWLATEKYRTDDENRLVAWKILAQDINRGNCFEKSIKLFNDIPKNVTFLKPGEDRQYWGYLCSAHGHQGTNGARGNLKNLEKAYDKIICGHVHQLEILRNAISVGTSTKIPLEYQIGNPSTSMSGNAAIYEGGIVQAIPIIKGLFAKAKTLEFLMRNKI